MGIWSAVRSVFSSNAKPVDDILDKDSGLLVKAGGWINDLSYTDAEKAKDVAALAQTVIQHAKDTASENTQRSLTRRHVAIGIIRVELFLVLACVVVWPIDKEYGKFLWEIASSWLMFGAFSAVIIFFFGSYGISQHIIKPSREGKK